MQRIAAACGKTLVSSVARAKPTGSTAPIRRAATLLGPRFGISVQDLTSPIRTPLPPTTRVISMAPVAVSGIFGGMPAVRSLSPLGSAFGAGKPRGAQSPRNFSTTAACKAKEEAAVTASSSGLDVSEIIEKVADPVVSGWWPSNLAEFGVVAVHDALGLPWYLSIIGITFSLRTILLPVVIFQMKNVARLALVKPEMEEITKRWKAMGGYAAPPKATDQYQKELKEVFAKHNCSPTRSMVGIFVQAPLFISFFLALRRMSETYPSFQEGGAYWFTDLSAVDPYFALPTIAAVSMLVSVEVGADTGQAMADQQQGFKTFMRIFSIVMIPAVVMAGIPNGVFMYWITANCFSLAQVSILKIPGVKPALGIPVVTPNVAAAAEQSQALKAPVIPDVVYSSRPTNASIQADDAEPAPKSNRGSKKGVRVKRKGGKN